MAGKSKAFDVHLVNMPLNKAADWLLTERIDHCRQKWKALIAAPNSAKSVHDARVASRRATAALDVFEKLLRIDDVRRLRRSLKHIRHDAGRLRDWDVFQDRINRWASLSPRVEVAVIDFLRGLVMGMRSRESAAFLQIPADPKRWELVSLRTRRRATSVKSLSEWANRTIPPILRDFERSIVQRTNQPSDLHRVRIKCKRLRYALENFLDSFVGIVQQTMYPQLELLQRLLGEMHDASVLDQRLQEMAAQIQSLPLDSRRRYEQGLRSLRNHLRLEMSAGLRQYRQWLRHWNSMRSSANWKTYSATIAASMTCDHQGRSERPDIS